jgi:hypothetical protein
MPVGAAQIVRSPAPVKLVSSLVMSKHRESLGAWIENLEERVTALEKLAASELEKPAENLEAPPKPGE